MAKERGLSEGERHVSPIETDDPDALTTATVAIVGAILVIIAVVFLQGLYERESALEIQRKIVDEAPAELRSLRAAQRARLNETGWLDKKHGIVAIPIDKAMELMVSDPNPAAPIVVSAAPGTPAPTTGASK